MKKIILSILSFVSINIAIAQAPDAFNYQTVVRDAGGTIQSSQNVSFRISILEGSALGNAVYSETHNLNTTAQGLANFKIGEGQLVSGDISTINWGANSHFVQVELDINGGSNFQLMGTSSLVSVPYALHAKTAENVFSGDYTDLNNVPNIPTNTSDLTNDAGFITNADDADADPANELQTLSLVGSNLSITNGNTVALPLSSNYWQFVNDSTALLGNTHNISAGSDLSIVSGTNNTLFNASRGFVMGSNNELRASNSGIIGLDNYSRGGFSLAVGYGDTIGATGFTLYKYAFGREIKIKYGGGVYDSYPSFCSGWNIESKSASYFFGSDIKSNIGVFNYGLGRFLELNAGNAIVIGKGSSAVSPLTVDKSNSFTLAFGKDGNNTPALFVSENTISQSGFVGLGTDQPRAKLEVNDGDIYLPNSNRGVIMTSPSGSCFRVTVDNAGNMVSTPIACP